MVSATVAEQLDAIGAVGDALVAATSAGRTVLAFGNGGSAAQAAHFTAELVGRYRAERAGIAAVCLAADAVALTALANDEGVERLFARQVEALARPGDVVVAISTSGTSPDVVAGVAAATARGCTTVALTGEGGGALAGAVDHLVAVPSPSVPRIQEVHAIVLHGWADAVERAALRP